MDGCWCWFYGFIIMLKYLVISDEGLFFLNFVYYEYIEIYLMKDIIDVNINLRLCVKMVMKKCVK